MARSTNASAVHLVYPGLGLWAEVVGRLERVVVSDEKEEPQPRALFNLYSRVHTTNCTLKYMMPARPPGRSDRKRAQIIGAARSRFLQEGYTATNLDDIAGDAGVSKVTIYNHFGSKEALFIAVMDHVIDDLSSGGAPVESYADAVDVTAALAALGGEILRTVAHPDIAGLRRVLIAEQPRHPELAERWSSATTLATERELTQLLSAWMQRGALPNDNANDLAREFLWMLIGPALDTALMRPQATAPSAEHVAMHAARTALRR